MSALIATAAAVPAAVAAGIVWVTVRGWRRQAARLRRRLFEIGLALDAERDTALDVLEWEIGRRAFQELDAPKHAAGGEPR